jgi:signal recognition particle GTPase
VANDRDDDLERLKRGVWDFNYFLASIEVIQDLSDAGWPNIGEWHGTVGAEDEYDLMAFRRVLETMTPLERRTPELLEGERGRERRTHLAARAGVALDRVDALITTFAAIEPEWAGKLKSVFKPRGEV